MSVIKKAEKTSCAVVVRVIWQELDFIALSTSFLSFFRPGPVIGESWVVMLDGWVLLSPSVMKQFHQELDASGWGGLLIVNGVSDNQTEVQALIDNLGTDTPFVLFKDVAGLPANPMYSAFGVTRRFGAVGVPDESTRLEKCGYLKGETRLVVDVLTGKVTKRGVNNWCESAQEFLQELDRMT